MILISFNWKKQPQLKNSCWSSKFNYTSLFLFESGKLLMEIEKKMKHRRRYAQSKRNFSRPSASINSQSVLRLKILHIVTLWLQQQFALLIDVSDFRVRTFLRRKTGIDGFKLQGWCWWIVIVLYAAHDFIKLLSKVVIEPAIQKGIGACCGSNWVESSKESAFIEEKKGLRESRGDEISPTLRKWGRNWGNKAENQPLPELMPAIWQIANMM